MCRLCRPAIVTPYILAVSHETQNPIEIYELAGSAYC